MKKLYLFRHAKSGWDDAVARDFDRPISAKGKRGAVVMGQYLREQAVDFDRVIASPAVRCAETVEYVEQGFGQALEPIYDSHLYLASAEQLLDVIQAQSDQYDKIMLIGHNPGLEDLVLLLVKENQQCQLSNDLRDKIEVKFPTAALATIELMIDKWQETELGTGQDRANLTGFIRPRDLSPELGPDYVD